MNAAPTLGTRIRRALERRRWTQRELADALGVSLRTVNDWINDRAAPRASIGAIEDILGVDLGEGPQPDPAITDAERVRRLLADHDPDIVLPDEWIERLTAEYLRLRRADSEVAS